MNFISTHFLLLIALVWLVGGVAMDMYENRKGMHL